MEKTFTKIKEILNKDKNYLNEKYGVIELGIFGSYAKNEQVESSDVDILVEFEKPISLLKIVSLENHITDILEIKADVIPKKNIRIELRDEIINEVIMV
ncbi:nucleotidyltransferase family protein [Dehalococcoidia bacterium]|nr:nucleotidyltransferase family protein [Dehalococcoidia bacterium]